MRLWNRLVGGGTKAIAQARRPQALAASRARPPLEGIDWLGRRPERRAPLLYRVLKAAAEMLVFGACRIRVEVHGRDLLPDGGYVAVCALHRSWVDPLVLVHALPTEPQVWFMGSGPTLFDRRWKESLLHRTGGLLPVWRGGTDVSVHVRSAQAVLDEGAVLGLFMEGRIGGPPDATASPRTGAALLALRTGAPIVPLALCGAEQLYRGKRISLRVLEPTSAAELLDGAGVTPAQAGTREELRQARAISRALAGRISDAVAADHPGTLDPPGAPRHWSWLTTLLR